MLKENERVSFELLAFRQSLGVCLLRPTYSLSCGATAQQPSLSLGFKKVKVYNTSTKDLLYQQKQLLKPLTEK